VSGIWPPDVGGPASHAPELAAFLAGRGHGVEVVTTADAAPAPERYPVRWVSRRVPIGVRHLAVARLVASRARDADVVYATSMLGRAALGAWVARRPLVVKLTGDPAFERARRRNIVAGDLDAFTLDPGGLRVRVLRWARDLGLRRAAHVFCPSAYLARLAVGWGVPESRVSVLPNAVPRADGVERRPPDRPTLAFAGRMMAAKALDDALEALAATEGVRLVLAGDGDERPALERRAAALGLGDRVEFVGAQPRDRVLALFASADASLLSSRWENFPHTIVEALAVGTPVISTTVGGVPEVVHDGVNGLLVPPGDPAALAAAIRRFYDEPGLRERLTANAAPSVAEYAPERVYERLETVLLKAAR
jgi:glycosyltransferase involved in cell wall biosynthesis